MRSASWTGPESLFCKCIAKTRAGLREVAETRLRGFLSEVVFLGATVAGCSDDPSTNQRPWHAAPACACRAHWTAVSCCSDQPVERNWIFL